MTPFDRALDPQSFLAPEVQLYRLARTRYADLTGVGAALAPGRWNRFGQKAIYASVDVGLPVLERLAHSPKNLIPTNLSIMQITVIGQWSPLGEHMIDHQTGAIFAISPTLEYANNEFRRRAFPFSNIEAGAFAVAVPSVIVPAWNVVLFPDGHAFSTHVKLQTVEPFRFDPRLFPEDVMTEDIE